MLKKKKVVVELEGFKKLALLYRRVGDGAAEARAASKYVPEPHQNDAAPLHHFKKCCRATSF
jgi:hypothetical protein